MQRDLQIQQTRRKILDSALVMFGKQGFDGVSMDGIRLQANLSKGILYHYFPSKENLYLCCLQECVEKMAEYLREHPVQGTTPAHQIREFIDLRHRFFQRFPLYEEIFYQMLLGNPNQLADKFAEIRQPLEEINMAFFQKVCDQFPPSDPKLEGRLKQFFWIILNGFWLSLQQSSLTLNPQTIEQQEEMISHMLEIFFCGLTYKAEKEDS